MPGSQFPDEKSLAARIACSRVPNKHQAFAPWLFAAPLRDNGLHSKKFDDDLLTASKPSTSESSPGAEQSKVGASHGNPVVEAFAEYLVPMDLGIRTSIVRDETIDRAHVAQKANLV